MDVKERIIRLINLFNEETDDDKNFSVSKIKEILEIRYQERVSSATIKSDLSILLYFGIIDLVDNNKYGAKLYSKINRKFENYELRLLLDAVRSGRFLTPDESKSLTKKIRSLTTKNMAKKVENKIYVNDRVVCENHNVKYYINSLHEAVYERRLVEFKYQKYDLDLKFKFKNDGKPYLVEPYGVVWEDSFYYLVGYSYKHNDFINFRIDRMIDVKILQKKFNIRDFNLKVHVKHCFMMFPGELMNIVLKFHHHLINAIIDYFGKNISFTKVDNGDYFLLRTKAAYNKGLVRWLLIWGSDMEVIKPQILLDDIKEETKKMYNIYHGVKEDT